MQSTDFAFSRFLVPYLCDYEGVAAFADGDMLARADISELFELADPDAAVSVVQHDYTPTAGPKFMEHEQTRYERKNWSSVMVFNCSKCHALTPECVNTASGLNLHQFKWARTRDIGPLPVEWNHLVGEYEPNPDAKLVHFTLGTPCFGKYARCEFAREWFEERGRMLDYNPVGEYSLAERRTA